MQRQATTGVRVTMTARKAGLAFVVYLYIMVLANRHSLSKSKEDTTLQAIPNMRTESMRQV